MAKQKLPSTKDLTNPVVDLIRAEMEACSHNQADAARAIKCTQITLSRVLARKVGVGRSLALRLARYLHVDAGAMYRACGLSPEESIPSVADMQEQRLRYMYVRASPSRRRQMLKIIEAVLADGDGNS
jgi:hypothetical protein